MLFAAVVRSNRVDVVLNVGSRESVIADAKLNPRIAVKRALPGYIALWAVADYQSALPVIRARYGLPGAGLDEFDSVLSCDDVPNAAMDFESGFNA